MRLNLGHGSWELLWGHVHRVLVLNLGTAVTNLPLLAALRVDQHPWRAPLFYLVLGLGAGPSLAAGFGYLDAAAAEPAPLRAYFRCYRRTFRRALVLWTPLLLLASVAAADAAALHGRVLGAALLPLHAVVVLLAVAGAVPAMADAASGPGGSSARQALLRSAYALLARPLPALLNLVLLAAGLLAVDQAPLYGLAVVPGCVLFVLWRHAGGMLARVTPRSAAAGWTGPPHRR